MELAAGEVKSQIVDLTGGIFQPAFLNETELVLAGKPEKAAEVTLPAPRRGLPGAPQQGTAWSWSPATAFRGRSTG